MKLFQQRLLAVAALFILVFAACKSKTVKEEKPPVIPVENFFKNPENFGWRISPDGEYISYLSPYKGHTNVFVRKIADSVAIPVTSDSVRNILTINGKVTGYYTSRILVVMRTFNFFSGIRWKESEATYTFCKVRTSILNDLRYVPGKEKEVMIQMNKRDPAF